MRYVYLAKSNNADNSIVDMIRNIINTKNGVNVLEYTGGKYSHTDVKKSECLIDVPEEHNSTMILGKGLFDQFNRNDNSYVVVLGNHEKVRAVKVDISKIEVVSSDFTAYAKYNYKKYGGRAQSLDFILPEEIIL